MLPAGTDTKHYVDVADDTYRFYYAVIRLDDMGGTHGTNERMEVVSYLDAIRFYVQLVKNTDEIESN
jgi:carboxypeptidase PM20D1